MSVPRPTQMSVSERREYYRLPIRVPIFIKGIDKNGDEFVELTHTINVSATGACLITKRDLAYSADLLVSIPAPVNSDVGSPQDQDFRFPAKVIRLEKIPANPSRRVSVRFSRILHESP
jgi:c-di-GMP-binding flagellar brake protein YcgR